RKTYSPGDRPTASQQTAPADSGVELRHVDRIGASHASQQIDYLLAVHADRRGRVHLPFVKLFAVGKSRLQIGVHIRADSLTPSRRIRRRYVRNIAPR